MTRGGSPLSSADTGAGDKLVTTASFFSPRGLGFSGIRSHPPRMVGWFMRPFRLAAATLQRRRELLLENLALRHQLLVLQRSAKLPRLSGPDRALWVWLARRWRAWKTCLWIVQPDTVIRWHRAGFRQFWKWKNRPRRGGRRRIDGAVVSLIRHPIPSGPVPVTLHGSCWPAPGGTGWVLANDSGPGSPPPSSPQPTTLTSPRQSPDADRQRRSRLRVVGTPGLDSTSEPFTHPSHLTQHRPPDRSPHATARPPPSV